MLLLARTTPADQVTRKTEGLSVFLIDMREIVGNGLAIQPIETMMNHHTTELFFYDLKIPTSCLVGEGVKGFRYILDGMNAERTLIGYECIGDCKFFIERTKTYVTEREVFGRPIGKNQGVQFPIARNYIEMRAAELMVNKASKKFDAGEHCGEEANMAKLLASEASRSAADTCLQTHGATVLPKSSISSEKCGKPSISGGSNFHKPDPVVCQRTCAENASILLMNPSGSEASCPIPNLWKVFWWCRLSKL